MMLNKNEMKQVAKEFELQNKNDERSAKLFKKHKTRILKIVEKNPGIEYGELLQLSRMWFDRFSLTFIYLLANRLIIEKKDGYYLS